MKHVYPARWKSRGPLAVLMIGIAGCVGAATAPSTAPVTTTAPTTQSSVRVLRLEDAVVGTTLETPARQIEFQSQIHFGNRAVLFGQLATYDPAGDDDDPPTATVPVVAFQRGDTTMALKIDDPRLKNAGWSYVESGPKRDEFWGVLDASLNDRQPDLVLVHSTDGAQTISMWSIAKPHAAAQFDSFCMDSTGKGRLSLYLTPERERRHHWGGYLNYHTTDGGEHWSAPQLEPDSMIPADDPPDEDTDKRPVQRAIFIRP